MLKLKLHWQILIAIVLAVPFGFLYKEIESVALLATFEFLGTFFINALKMLIVPLIVSAIISGISNIGTEKGFARLGLKTVGYYAFTSFIAIVTGLIIVNITQPGIIDGVPAKEILGFSEMTASKVQAVEGKGASDIVAIFLRMVPPNIVSAAAKGQMLGLITFSLLFGFFMMRIKKEYSDLQLTFWNGIYEVMLKMTHLVMRFAPLGVFGLIAKTVSKTGLDAIEPLTLFFFTVLGALLVHMFVSMPVMLKFFGLSPKLHFRNMSPALLTAFSTSSSSATLPETMECVKRSGASKKVTSFVLPLGATVNMDGTALYECVAAMFIAQAYGLEIDIATQFIIVLVALLTSIGVAGIPSASLVAIVIILGAIGLPAEGIGLILAVDRILDMCRTSVNVWSDSCGAVLIAKTEGEEVLNT
ncbi:MAG: dicarboxylate/amino acid:cation symporter [Fibrobacterales bacterium]